MIICLCANVSERELRATIADGASTVKEVGRRCGAGAGCGACKPMIRECLREARATAEHQAAGHEVMISETERAFPAAPELVPA